MLSINKAINSLHCQVARFSGIGERSAIQNSMADRIKRSAASESAQALETKLRLVLQKAVSAKLDHPGLSNTKILRASSAACFKACANLRWDARSPLYSLEGEKQRVLFNLLTEIMQTCKANALLADLRDVCNAIPVDEADLSKGFKFITRNYVALGLENFHQLRDQFWGGENLEIALGPRGTAIANAFLSSAAKTIVDLSSRDELHLLQCGHKSDYAHVVEKATILKQYDADGGRNTLIRALDKLRDVGSASSVDARPRQLVNARFPGLDKVISVLSKKAPDFGAHLLQMIGEAHSLPGIDSGSDSDSEWDEYDPPLASAVARPRMDRFPSSDSESYSDEDSDLGGRQRHLGAVASMLDGRPAFAPDIRLFDSPEPSAEDAADARSGATGTLSAVFDFGPEAGVGRQVNGSADGAAKSATAGVGDDVTLAPLGSLAGKGQARHSAPTSRVDETAGQVDAMPRVVDEVRKSRPELPASDLGGRHRPRLDVGAMVGARFAGLPAAPLFKSPEPLAEVTADAGSAQLSATSAMFASGLVTVVQRQVKSSGDGERRAAEAAVAGSGRDATQAPMGHPAGEDRTLRTGPALQAKDKATQAGSIRSLVDSGRTYQPRLPVKERAFSATGPAQAGGASSDGTGRQNRRYVEAKAPWRRSGFKEWMENEMLFAGSSVDSQSQPGRAATAASVGGTVNPPNENQHHPAGFKRVRDNSAGKSDLFLEELSSAVMKFKQSDA